MLLIIFLGLIANSALVSGVCNLGPPTLNNFNWSKVGNSVLQQSAAITAACVYILMLVPLTNRLSIERIRLYIRVME
jgi:hypothetical protein